MVYPDGLLGDCECDAGYFGDALSDWIPCPVEWTSCTAGGCVGCIANAHVVSGVWEC